MNQCVFVWKRSGKCLFYKLSPFSTWPLFVAMAMPNSSSSSIPSPRGSLGHHRWFYNQFSPFFPVFTALWDLLNSRPYHSLMLFSHLFLCLPCLLPPFIVPVPKTNLRVCTINMQSFITIGLQANTQCFSECDSPVCWQTSPGSPGQHCWNTWALWP